MHNPGTVFFNMRRLIIKSPRSIRQKISIHLREQLLSGKIPPNHHLIEAKIAKEIGTSRTPVRESLHSLELEGVIESIPRIGDVVKPMSEEEALTSWEGKLARYKMPKQVKFVSQLPMTAAEKIKRNKLREVYLDTEKNGKQQS